jgi:hypothetical protein
MLAMRHGRLANQVFKAVFKSAVGNTSGFGTSHPGSAGWDWTASFQVPTTTSPSTKALTFQATAAWEQCLELPAQHRPDETKVKNSAPTVLACQPLLSDKKNRLRHRPHRLLGDAALHLPVSRSLKCLARSTRGRESQQGPEVTTRVVRLVDLMLWPAYTVSDIPR